MKDPFSNPDIPCPLTKDEITALATFNSERSRGLVHRPSYAWDMAKLQEKYDEWSAACIAASGGTVVVVGGEQP